MKKLILITFLVLFFLPSVSHGEETKVNPKEPKITEEKKLSTTEKTSYGAILIVLGIIIFKNNRNMNV